MNAPARGFRRARTRSSDRMRPAGFRPFTFKCASDVSQAMRDFHQADVVTVPNCAPQKFFCNGRVTPRRYPQRILEHLATARRCLDMSEKPIEHYQLHLAPAVLQNVDGWRGKQPESLDRDEAIRRLVELGLSASSRARSTKAKTRAPKIRSKAADMAGAAIDRHTDRSATCEEQESRKRQLLNGPEIPRFAPRPSVRLALNRSCASRRCDRTCSIKAARSSSVETWAPRAVRAMPKLPTCANCGRSMIETPRSMRRDGEWDLSVFECSTVASILHRRPRSPHRIAWPPNKEASWYRRRTRCVSTPASGRVIDPALKTDPCEGCECAGEACVAKLDSKQVAENKCAEVCAARQRHDRRAASNCSILLSVSIGRVHKKRSTLSWMARKLTSTSLDAGEMRAASPKNNK